MPAAPPNLATADALTLMKAILSGERFWPTEPQTFDDTGLTEHFVEGLILKTLAIQGASSGRAIAGAVCLPLAIIEPLLARLRAAQWIVFQGVGTLNDYIYTLTEEGRRQAAAQHRECAYVGPAPVPLSDYVISVEAQAASDEPIRRSDLLDALFDVSIDSAVLNLLGPAVNSATGLFLYGAPGNGKSTIARRITACFGQEIWLPHAFIEGKEIVKVFDPTYHTAIDDADRVRETSGDYDRRWLRVRRPTVVVGGELTMEDLDIRVDRSAGVSEAPLQLKSNCGCLLIDDFGRQRITPATLLNRWIIPLENRHDYLTLGSGKKVQVPFEQLVIFSTNLDPADLVDEAFLRRIRYRIEVKDPTEEEFHGLFRMMAEQSGCEYHPDAVEHLLEKHYRPQKRALRRCHARDLLQQVRHYCTFNELPFEMLPEYFDEIAPGFFTTLPVKAAQPLDAADYSNHGR